MKHRQDKLEENLLNLEVKVDQLDKEMVKRKRQKRDYQGGN